MLTTMSSVTRPGPKPCSIFGRACLGCGCTLLSENMRPSDVTYKRPRCARCSRAFQRGWRRRNRDKVARQNKKKASAMRRAAVAAYGGRCACCGEDTFEFLTIDHVNNDGAAHRRQVGIKGSTATYYWLRDNGYPKDGFQLLCMNCNCAKQWSGECPHQTHRREGGLIGGNGL